MYEVTPNCGQIHLGKQGENSAKLIYFAEPSLWQKVFGEGRCELIHQRCGDAAPYPIALKGEGENVYWEVSAADTAIPGNGKCELRYIVGDTVVKSTVWVTTVLPSLEEATAEVPEPSKSWVDQVLKAAEMIMSATTHQPTIGDNGNWYVWDATANDYKDSGVSARGDGGNNARRIAYINVFADKWVQENEHRYSQIVAVPDVTEHSQVDITLDADQVEIFRGKDLAFTTKNVGGVVTVSAIGQKPTNDYTFQVTITEVSL
jgi:hypothetical protein